MYNQRLLPVGTYLGSDPELFVFDQDGNVVPSFAVIPPEGLPPWGYTHCQSKVSRDGVQVELQPPAGTCREEQANWTTSLMKSLKEALPPGATINFTSNIVIPHQQFLMLDPEARKLGCAPSLNVYGPAPIRVNSHTYRRRSAGGHIHLGSLMTTIASVEEPLKRKVPTEFAIKLVKTLDAVLGNTCVLIDRDPAARIRRRVYGRAGEYRLPGYSRLEYRTLSNFWMRAPYLQSFVYAVARQAVDIVSQYNDLKAYPAWDAHAALWKNLDEQKVQKAINRNDYNLAFENWQVVREFMQTHNTYQKDGLAVEYLPQFDRFLAHVKEYGLDTVVPADPTAAWIDRTGGYYVYGFETFITEFDPARHKPQAA